jgi:putative intracellular protease/amidase
MIVLAIRKLIALVPWQAWALAGILTLAAGWHWKEVRAAVQASYAALVAQSEKQGRAADAAEMDVLRCPAGRWNRETGRCNR